MDIKTIIIIILSIIVAISLVVIIKQRKNNKKQESYATMVFGVGVSIVLTASSDWLDKVLIGIGVITKYKNPNELGGTFNWAFFVLGSALIIISILIFLYSKKKFYVLNINGYTSRRLEDEVSKLKSDNSDFREREIDFINIYKRVFSKKFDKASYECIKAEIDEKVIAFKNETKFIKRGYTGIAPIPFIMYAGTLLNRVDINEYYEFDKKDTHKYYLLSKNKNVKYPELKIKTDLTQLDVNKSEVLVAISVTQKIEDNVLGQFIPNCNLVRIEVDNPEDNTIKNQHQLMKYVAVVISVIEEIKKTIPNLKVNLVYSGQSCLALELGKAFFDDTRMPTVIIYHYDFQQQVNKYPWGIIINGSDKGKLIKA